MLRKDLFGVLGVLAVRVSVRRPQEKVEGVEAVEASKVLVPSAIFCFHFYETKYGLNRAECVDSCLYEQSSHR